MSLIKHDGVHKLICLKNTLLLFGLKLRFEKLCENISILRFVQTLDTIKKNSFDSIATVYVQFLLYIHLAQLVECRYFCSASISPHFLKIAPLFL